MAVELNIGGRPKLLTKVQSTVQFPYADFEEALSVARAIHEAGGPMTKDQLAARMGQNITGAFTSKISAARMFGLIVFVQNAYRVTSLGYEVLDGSGTRAKTARAHAFLRVELYRKLYDEYRGKPLPPRPSGLEEAIGRLGVAPKQRTNARYAFDRSAKQTGFFEHGNERLVEPVANAGDTGPDDDAQSMRGRDKETEGLDVVIAALVAKLPRGKSTWDAAQREAWLAMMEMAFNMAYGAPKPEEPLAVAGPRTEALVDRLKREKPTADPDDDIPF